VDKFGSFLYMEIGAFNINVFGIDDTAHAMTLFI
jgi:hypothetical protein